MSALSRNVWDTVSNPGVVFSAGANTNNLTAVTFSNSNGVSFGLNAGVITATFSGGTGGGGAGTGFTSATTAGTAIVGTLNSNGLSVGIPAYLTTAALSGDTSKYAGTGFTTATTAGTNIVGTLATNGISLGVPAYLTTYVNDLTSGRAGTGFTSATTAGTAIVGTLNTNGLSVGVPAYLTTAALSGDTSKYAGIGFTSATTAGTAVVGTLSTNGFSVGVPAYITTYVNDLTSGRAGTGFTSTSTAGANIVGTLGTNGLSVGVPAYLTTAMASGAGSNFVAATASFAGTNASGTIASNAISVSVAAPGGGAVLSYYENPPLFIGASTYSGSSNSVIYFSPFILPQAVSASFVRFPIIMSYVSTVSAGTSVNTSFTQNISWSHGLGIYTQGTGASSASLVMSTSALATWVFQMSVTAGATGSQYTVWNNVTFPISGGASNYATSSGFSTSDYQNQSGNLTLFTGQRFLDIPFAASLSAGNYWVGMGVSTNSAKNAGPNLTAGSMQISVVGMTQVASAYNEPGIAANSTNLLQPGVGSFTTNVAIFTTTSIALNVISTGGGNSNMRHYFQMIRSA